MQIMDIQIAPDIADKISKLLSGEETDNLKDGETLYKETVYFDDNIEVDVKLVQGNTWPHKSLPYVDTVVFKDGCEVIVMEPSDSFVGYYSFEFEGKKYSFDISRRSF